MRNIRLLYSIICAFLLSFSMAGQGVDDNSNTRPPTISQSSKKDTSRSKVVRIVSADKQVYDATGDDERVISTGSVRIAHDSVYMFCDTATLINGSTLVAKGNISIIKNDTIRVFSDSLLYQSDSLMAYFVGDVVLEDGDQQLFTSFLQYDLEKDWAIYTDTALLITADMEIKSKRGIFHLKDDYVNFYDNVTIQGDDFDLLSDSLRFYTEAKRALFLSPTLINQQDKKIYAERGFYDLDDKVSLFYGNAQYIEGDKVSTADTIRNNEAESLTTLIGNAVFQSSEEYGSGDKIIYNGATENIELLGNAYFRNSENEVTGNQIFFDQKTSDVKVQGRSMLSNPPMIIVADDLDYNQTTGTAFADGNVVWKDTSANYEIVCDHARYVDSTDYMTAYNDVGKPILKNEVSQGDTLFLSGDTLISYTITSDRDSATVDTSRFFIAYQNVELLNEEMQAVADSLVYNGQDSIFTLHGDPIMWSDSSQYTGDTIVIYMNDNKLKQLDLLVDAMIISTDDFVYYNQIKGKVIRSKFVAGEIDNMKVNGSAQSIFYMKDSDEAYTGVNQTECSNMHFLFDSGELTITRYYKVPTSKLIPMEKADHENMKLPGFNWRFELKPTILQDLFN